MPAPKRKPSVLKRARQTETRRMRNRSAESKVKTMKKNVLEAIAKGDKEGVKTALSAAVKAIDAASSKGVLHRNNASRSISRLTRRASAIV